MTLIMLLKRCIILVIFTSCAAMKEKITKTINVKYFSHPPYIYKENGNVKGILPRLLKEFEKGIPCEEDEVYIFAKYVAQKEHYTDLIAEIKNVTDVVGDSKTYALAPIIGLDVIPHTYVPKLHTITLFNSYGYTLVSNIVTQSKMYKIVVFGLQNSVSLLMMLIMSTAIAGLLIWLVERDCKSNNADFRYPFLQGFWDGLWWSSVTLTTVGYGDKTPKSALGRCFGMVWLFIACALLASFTAILTSALTEGANSLSGKKIAYVNGTTADNYIIENSGVPVVTSTYEEAIQKAKNLEVIGSLLETNYVSHDQEKLYKHGLIVERRVHEKSLKIYLLMPMNPEDRDYIVCFKKYIAALASAHPLKLKGNPHRSIADQLKPSNSPISMTFTITYGIVIVLLLIGVTIQVVHVLKTRSKLKPSDQRIQGYIMSSNAEKFISGLQININNIENELKRVKSTVEDIKKNIKSSKSNLAQHPEENMTEMYIDNMYEHKL